MVLKNRLITTESIENLRDNTPVGSFIKFRRHHSYDNNWDDSKKFERVSGVITAKYNYIFVLDNGRAYSWVDYILGRVR